METLVFMDAKLKTYIFVKDSMVQFLFSSFLGNQTSCKHRDQRGIFTCIWAWASPPINPRLTHFFLLGMHFSLGGTGCWPPNIENLYRIIKRSVLCPFCGKALFGSELFVRFVTNFSPFMVGPSIYVMWNFVKPR